MQLTHDSKNFYISSAMAAENELVPDVEKDQRIFCVL